MDLVKGMLPDSVPKEIIAFANTEGGELFIGIRKDGTVVGVDDPDDVMTRVSNVVQDTILPDVMPFIRVGSVEMDGKLVVKITVSAGSERPYYLAKEGLKPKGVYVRRGSACIPLNESLIREMIMDSSGKSYEECRSLNQELTFETLAAEMASRNIEFGSAQMKMLKMGGSDGLYTNLALLLSDQCAHTIKAAVFQGNDSAVFRERREFTGSLLKQLGDAYQFLDFFNKTQASFEGIHRTDQRDYPEDALREALLNSIVHRDYLFSGSTIINMFDGHVEFISLGGLVSGISMEAIFMGVSQSRNLESSPVFRTAEGAFTVELSNRNEVKESMGGPETEIPVGRRVSRTQKDREAVYSLAKDRGSITRKEVEEACGIGSTKAFKILKALCEDGLLVQDKRGNQTVYSPV